MPSGYRFQPGLGTQGDTSGLAGTRPSRPQSAVRMLSFRVPKRAAPQALAPQALLTGGARGNPAMLSTVLSALLGAFRPGTPLRRQPGLIAPGPAPVPEVRPTQPTVPPDRGSGRPPDAWFGDGRPLGPRTPFFTFGGPDVIGEPGAARPAFDSGLVLDFPGIYTPPSRPGGEDRLQFYPGRGLTPPAGDDEADERLRFGTRKDRAERFTSLF